MQPTNEPLASPRRSEHAVLVKYGELWLKSDPVRRRFEKILKENIKKEYKKITKGKGGTLKVTTTNGRMFIHLENQKSKAKAKPLENILRRTFGVISFASCLIVDKNIDEIKAAALKIIPRHKSHISPWRNVHAPCTFYIQASRTDKSFPLDSSGIKKQVGMFLEAKGLRADFEKPTHVLKIEIRGDALLYTNEKSGPGGLPLGSGGFAAAYMRDTDDLLSAYLVMKRGVDLIFIKPNKKLLKTIERWCAGRKIKTASSIKNTKVKAIVDARAGENKSEGFVLLNPLAGFAPEEKGKLLKLIAKG